MFLFRYYLWIAPHVVLAFVLFASLRKRLHKELPVFFTYIVFETLRFVLLFAVSRLIAAPSIDVYLWFLTCTGAIGVPLQLAVIYELANNLIFSRTSVERILRPAFTWTVAGLVLFAALTSGALRDISREKIWNGFGILDFSSSLVQVGILVALFLFSRVLQVSWRSRTTGVAFGFGVSACINLAAAAMRSGLGKSSFIPVDIAQMAAFHVSVLIWLVYLSLPDQAPAFGLHNFEKFDIQFWNQELQRMTER